LKRVRVVVRGDVHGDGAVEAAFEGEPEAVDALVDWSRRGPRGARVDEIEIEAEAPQQDAGFRIR